MFTVPGRECPREWHTLSSMHPANNITKNINCMRLTRLYLSIDLGFANVGLGQCPSRNLVVYKLYSANVNIQNVNWTESNVYSPGAHAHLCTFWLPTVFIHMLNTIFQNKKHDTAKNININCLQTSTDLFNIALQ
jgi:hypothetical protein